jgi:hypothetical protein
MGAVLILMRFTFTAAVLALASLVPGQSGAAPPQSTTAVSDLPVSISRIREALKKPVGIRVLPEPRADFKVEVNQQQKFRDLLDLIDFSGGPVPPGGWYSYQQGQVTGRTSQPLVNFDVGAIGQAVGGAFGKARRARAEQLAREEVQRALIDYCNAHECSSR